MSPIVRASNWGYWDTLDGVKLRDGERLRVRWPDGTESEETCHIEDRGTTIGDHGHSYEGEDSSAFVFAVLRLYTVKAFLRADGILCERVAP